MQRSVAAVTESGPESSSIPTEDRNTHQPISGKYVHCIKFGNRWVGPGFAGTMPRLNPSSRHSNANLFTGTGGTTRKSFTKTCTTGSRPGTITNVHIRVSGYARRTRHTKTITATPLHDQPNRLQNQGFAPIFYGQQSEFTSNRADEHELSVLCLRILQAALVYVNTLLLQDVLVEPEWASILAPEDKRGLTPLFWSNIAPYGEVRLDMNTRLNIPTAA
jgi:Tn3 transposase DDE domain